MGEAYLRSIQWSCAPPSSLPAGAIHLWRLPLDAPPADPSLLSPAERTRLARMVEERSRRRRVNARAFLRLLLGRYLQRDPRAIELTTGPDGKPALVGGSLHFNLSHSGALGLVALSRTFEVGVDLERIRPVARMERIAARLFDPDTRQAVANGARELRLFRFFEAWTRLEARQKCVGTGLFGKRQERLETITLEPERDCLGALAWRPLEERGNLFPPPELAFFQFHP